MSEYNSHAERIEAQLRMLEDDENSDDSEDSENE